jgi:LDH2 family malate/lactate/ureidoglycolate dehydrogenase
MDLWIQTMRNTKAIPGKKVLIPGDLERAAEIENLRNGIEILPGIQKDLIYVAGKLGCDFEPQP